MPTNLPQYILFCQRNIAAGSRNNEYSFADRQLQVMNFYHPKMVDKDARFTYSSIINIRADQSNHSSIAYSQFSKDRVTISIGSNELPHTQAMLTDEHGRCLKSLFIAIRQYSPCNVISQAFILSGCKLKMGKF